MAPPRFRNVAFTLWRRTIRSVVIQSTWSSWQTLLWFKVWQAFM